MKSNWIRFLAGVLVSVMIVGIFIVTGGMKGGRSTNGLLYQASGLHPDGEMLAISGQTVTCEEYLFWLGMVCDNITASIPDVDWSAAITEDGMTFAEYAKTDAVEAAKQHAVVRAWAQQAGVALSDTSIAELAAQRQQYVAYYGSEEAYLQQLALTGISEEAYNGILEDQYLYRDLYQAFCTPGSSLYADDAALTDYAAQMGYMGAYVLKLTGDNAETMAADLLERWQAAEDKEKEYALICDELQQVADGVVTLTAVEGDALSDAMSALEIGGMTAVIDPYGEGTSFVVLRTDPDLAAVAETYFDVLWNQKMEEATVVTNSKLYDSVEVGTFYEKLLQLRKDMMAELGLGAETGDTANDSVDDSQNDSADSTADDAQPAA